MIPVVVERSPVEKAEDSSAGVSPAGGEAVGVEKSWSSQDFFVILKTPLSSVKTDGVSLAATTVNVGVDPTKDQQRQQQALILTPVM